MGARADLVVFDPRRVADGATYEDPHRYAAGVEHVLVNGSFVIKDGEPSPAACRAGCSRRHDEARAVPDLLTPLATRPRSRPASASRCAVSSASPAPAVARWPSRPARRVAGSGCGRVRRRGRGPARAGQRVARRGAAANAAAEPTGAGARRVIRCLPLGAPRRPVGTLALVGRAGTRPRVALPGGFGRELGEAIEQVWRLQQRTLRLTVHNEITRLLVSGDSIDEVLRVFAEGLGRLVDFDGLAVALLDPERPEFEVLDVLARSVPHVTPRDGRMGLDPHCWPRSLPARRPSGSTISKPGGAGGEPAGARRARIAFGAPGAAGERAACSATSR